MLQLFDRAGCLYAELARFVLRLLGFKVRMTTPSTTPPIHPLYTPLHLKPGPWLSSDLRSETLT
eukprot:7554723-Pyramimonas_sp.AAC.1